MEEAQRHVLIILSLLIAGTASTPDSESAGTASTPDSESAGTASTPDSESGLCGDCYRIDTVTLVGVVFGDILLTIIIILVVYFCTKQSFQKKESHDDKKVYMNMPTR